MCGCVWMRMNVDGCVVMTVYGVDLSLCMYEFVLMCMGMCGYVWM